MCWTRNYNRLRCNSIPKKKCLHFCRNISSATTNLENIFTNWKIFSLIEAINLPNYCLCQLDVHAFVSENCGAVICMQIKLYFMDASETNAVPRNPRIGLQLHHPFRVDQTRARGLNTMSCN